MKGFLSKVTAVLSAAVIMMGTLAVLPEEWLPKFGIVSSAANSYSEFSNVPCGMNCKMSLSNGVLTISGSGPMFNLLYNDIGEMYSGLGDYYDWTYYNDYITSCKSYIKEVKFSNSITYIGSYAFSGSNITNISLPNSITDIGSWAFSDCSSLSKVTMNKVESIGYGCFSYCPKLTEVSFPNTLKTIGMEAFVCDGLISVDIPESVKELNIDAFSGMSSLQKIVIPKNTEINDFLGLNNSPNVTIYSYSGSSSENFAMANNIPFIALDEDISTNNGKCGENAFWELSANGQLLITGTGKMYDFQENAAPWSSLVDQIKEINVADGVEYIGKNAFNGCLSAKNITLGSTVSDIGYNSFKGCSSLTSISLPEGIEWIKSHAFYDCVNLTHIYLPESATFIGNFTFFNCKNLKEIVVPYNVKAIGLAAFNGCENLKSIVIPDSVTTIPPKESCFNNSNDLTIYGNTGSYAETYANDNNIPFIALDTIEGKMLYKIKLKSGQQIYSYLFVDMDHDGQKEMIASVYNEKTNKYDIWYCSSNLFNCRLVYSTSMCFLDYCKIDSIDYAKSLLPLDDNWLKQAVKFVGDGIEIAVRTLIDPLHGISKAYQDTVKVHFNAIYYQRRADFVKRNLYCHGSIFDTVDGSTQYFKMVSENYLRLLEADAQLAAVMCPVEVEVYNGSNELVGVISETRNTIENSSEIYVYRNNSADANIIVCPSDYSIKIKGLNNGEMTVLSNYYTNSEIARSVAYSKVPITNGYVAEIDITADTDSLTDNTGRNLSSDPIEAFVERLYQNILNRPGDAHKADHIANLKNGKSACEVAFDFVFSDEFRDLPISNEERIKRMYVAFLDREAEADGLAAWTAILDNGCSIGHIFFGFTQSNEFTELSNEYGIVRGDWKVRETRDVSPKLTAFVSRLYTQALNRDYDVDGLNNHTANYLANGDLYQLAYNFIFSSEFIERELSDEDFVDTMYRTFFDREGDPVGKADWLGKLKSGCSREEVLAGFVGSQECADLVAKFGI